MAYQLSYDNDRDYIDHTIYEEAGDAQPYTPQPYSSRSTPVYYDGRSGQGEYESFVEDYGNDNDAGGVQYADTEYNYGNNVVTSYSTRDKVDEYRSRIEQVPFYAQTTNQQEYVWKDPLPKPVKSEPVEVVHLPFYDETTNKADFHKKIPIPTKSFKPKPGGLGKDVPFYSETSNRIDFGPKVALKTKAIKREQTVGYGGIPFESITTNQAEYVQKRGERQKSLRVRSAGLFPSIEKDHRTLNQLMLTEKNAHRCPAEMLINAGKNRARKINGHWFVRQAGQSNKTNEQISLPILSNRRRQLSAPDLSRVQSNYV